MADYRIRPHNVLCVCDLFVSASQQEKKPFFLQLISIQHPNDWFNINEKEK